jgi:hypothetical protein
MTYLAGKLAPIVALAAVLVACAGGGAVPTPTPQSPIGTPLSSLPRAAGLGQASGAPATVVPASVPTPASVPGLTIDACALLSDADLLAATGSAVSSREVSHLTRLFPSVCDIELDGGGSLTVSVMPTGGRLLYDTSFEPFIGVDDLAPLDRAVEGLGDKAGMSGDDTVMVVSGDVLFQLLYLNAARSDSEEMLRYMAEIIVAKLPCIATGCPGYTPPPPLPAPEVTDVCSLLTAEEIEAAVGEATLPTEPSAGIDPGCAWPLESEPFPGADYVELSVKETGGQAEFDFWATAYDPPLEHVPGIGDDAVKTQTIPGGTVISVIGDRAVTLKFSLPLSVDDPYALVVPLLEAALSRLR